VKQLGIHTTDRAKQGALISLIETYRPFLAVIFCRTKRRVSKLYDALKAHGFSCDELHGDLSQGKREQVMKRFREAEIQLLVATDVAARGLDIEGITHVFNYDIPQDAESYVHRIGRTGRAGMTGLAVTFYSSADLPALEQIEKELSITIPKQSDGNQTNEKKSSEGDRSDKRSVRPAKTHGHGRETQKNNRKDGNRDKNGNDRRSEGSGRGAQKESTKRSSVMKDSRGKRTNFSASSKSNRGSGKPTTARSSRKR
jgi:ATP-dependent RNA helicase DeaD